MRCHYDVLQVERDVSSKELRKAFYQLALKWHPDKHQSNGISPEEATERFQEIQNAYEVLNDPHERKWYDDHRDQILRGDDSDAEDSDAPYEMNLWKYFSPSVYSGFGDDPNSFYSVYHEIFAKIDALDMSAASGSAAARAPEFGDAATSSDQVNDFYQFWKGYVTQQTFSWLDEYKTTDAPNRQIRRAMEKENKKLRDAAKKKFIAEVRELVEFVKKRDPRMVALQQQREELRKAMEAEEEERKQAKRAEFELQKQQFEAQQHEMWQQMEDQRRHGFRDDGVSDEQLTSAFSNLVIEQELEKMRQKLDAEVLVCDLCRKTFKSMKQLKNHLVSKKHREKEAEIGVVCDLDDLLQQEIELEVQQQQQQQKQQQQQQQSQSSHNSDEEEENQRVAAESPQVVAEDEEAHLKKQQEEQIRIEKAEKAAAKRQERKQKRKEQKQKQVEQIVQTAQQKTEKAAKETTEAINRKKKNKRKG